MKMYDVIIIGMGPAGITAGIYAIRSGLKTLMLEKEAPGGLVNYTNIINNYPGLPNIKGADLAYKYFEHVNDLKIPYELEEVIEVIDNGDEKIVKTKSAEYKSKTVIIATGRNHRKLDLPNAESLEGRGISYCAICDGPFYKDLDVAVVGGGNSALGQTLYLANLCNKVTILNRSSNLRGTNDYQERLKKLDNVEVKLDTEIIKIEEKDNKINKLKLSNGEELNVDGIFVYIGFDPATSFVNDLNITDEYGYIVVNKKHETSIPGIYACGDIVAKDLYQIITAASEGSIAADSVFEYLKNN